MVYIPEVPKLKGPDTQGILNALMVGAQLGQMKGESKRAERKEARDVRSEERAEELHRFKMDAVLRVRRHV